MIKLNSVSRLYPARAEAGEVIRALDSVSLHVESGEWLAIMGPSGSGKSTLVNLIGCLDRPTSGEIWLEGENVANISNADLNRVRAEKVVFIFRQLHQQGRTIVMVTHDPVVARLADRRIELHHGKIAMSEVFSMADEEQLDEVLEELWVLAEHGEIAEIGRMEVHGALPVGIAVEKMTEMGFVTTTPHPLQAHNHKPFVNPCHDALKPTSVSIGDGSMIVELTPRGRQRAADIIRRHRLAERLFTDSLALDSETEIEQQACKFEHILSPEATDKICTFLGHPRTCPHGAPIPPGACCGKEGRSASLLASRQELV